MLRPSATRTRISGSSASTPSQERTRSRNGQYVIDSPYETHFPSSQRGRPRGAGPSSNTPRNSERSLVFPMPGSPVMNTIAPVPSSAARASSRTSASSRSRPTTGAWTPSIPRVETGDANGATTGLAATEPDFPFSSRSRDGPHSKIGSTRAAVPSPTRIVPGSASAWSRAATFTASPIAPYSTREPAPTAPTTTGPDSTPTRTPNPSIPQLRRTSSANSPISSTIRNPARRARSGSSSCATGAPKSASTPSPARSLIVPPNASTAPTIRPTASPTTSFSSSGSSRSPRAVDPTRSANSAVTNRRSSRIAGLASLTAASSQPHGDGATGRAALHPSVSLDPRSSAPGSRARRGIAQVTPSW